MRRPSSASLFSRHRRPLAATVIYALFFQLVLPAAPLTRPVALPMRPFFATQAAATAAMEPAALANDATVVLHDVVTGANDVAALEHEPSSNHLLAAAEGGQTALATIDSDGAPHPFSSLASVDEPIVTTSRATGDVFVAGSGSSVIARVKSGGTAVVSPWVTLANGAIADLHVDDTGAWGGDLIAVTTTGAVWRIAMSGQAKLVANINVAPAGVTTVAVDEGRHGPWSGAIVVGARASATLHAIDSAGVVKAFTIGVTPRDLAVVTAHENFYGIDRAAGKIRGARGDAFAQMSGDLVVAQHSPGVLARVRWDGAAFVTSKVAEGGKWDRVVFSPAGVGAIPPARRIYDAVAVVRHAPVLTGGRIEGALWQLTGENLTLDGTDVITSDLLVPGTPKVVVGSGKPSFNGVIQGSDSAEPSGYTITIQGNAALRHVINRTDPMTLPSVIPPPAPAGTRDVALSAAGETPGSFATLRNLSLSGKAGEVTVPAGTYGRFSATGRTVMIFGTAGATSAAIYNLERLDLAGGAELRVAGPTVINLRDGATVTGASAGAINAPGQLILNVAGGDVQVLGTAVLAALVRVPSGAVAIDGTGLLRGTVGADRLSVSGNGVLQVTQNDVPPPQVNRPPSVSAGADQTITLPDDTLRLEGSVSDDGLPRGSSLAVLWSVVSGTGVSFSDANAAITTVTFAAPGTYVLRLAANDSALRTTDDITITVLPENKPPVVQAGADQRIELPAAATLAGVATDDGLPAGSSLKTTWSRASGPGTVTFDDASKLAARATFSAAGVYTLRLSVTDGEETVSDDVTITVDPHNEPPAVAAGDDQFIVLPNTATLRGTATDDGWPHGSTLATQWTKVSGSGEVTFGDAAKPATTVSFATAGIYVLRLTATDGRATRSDEVTVTVDPANLAPSVSAGDAATVELPGAATLNGVVDDDGWPRGSTLSITWSMVSGPAAVTFADARAAATSATFTRAGEYILRLAATDGALTASDDVTMTVYPQNQAPAVDAGADTAVVLPNTAALRGTATDDGWPHGSTLTTAWTRVSGPGQVTFADATRLETSATFTAAGVYVLRLSATDTRESVHDDVTITADPANQAPLVSAGSNVTIELSNAAALRGTVTDDGWPRGSKLTQRWSVVSGTGVTFADATAAATTATFATTGTYVLRLTATDGDASASADVTITVHPENQAPTVNAGADATVRLPAAASLSGTASDDGWPLGSKLTTTWSKVSGAGTVTFADVSALSTTASFSAAGTYVLRLTASDTRATASDDVTVVVLTANQGPAVNAGADANASAGANLVRNGGGEAVSTDGSVEGWSAVSGLFARAESGAVEGSAYLRANATSEVTQEVDVAAVPQGTPFELSAFVRGAARIAFEFRGASGTLLDTFEANAQPSAGWTAVTETRAGPAGTTRIRVRLIASGEASFDAVSVRAPGIATTNLLGAISDDGLPAGNTLAASWSTVSGPAAVVFADATQARTTVAFSKPGTYVLRLTATDGELSASDEVSIVVSSANQPPVVDAGGAQSVRLPGTVTLAGRATDDNLPAGSVLAISWTAATGADSVTIAGASTLTPTLTFAKAGTYVLRLTVSDSELTIHDDVTITVAAANHPPVVNAGADATVTLPEPASLSGSASDEDGDAVTLRWSVVSGGPVTFANATSAITTATFAAAGTYVLRLTATDGELSVSDDVAITVRPEPVNQAPVVDAGEPQTVGVGEQAELHGTATDDGLPVTGALSVAWTAVSGPGDVTFASPNAAETGATFSAAGTYTLRLSATDSLLTAFDDTTVTVLNTPVAAFTVPGVSRFGAHWNNNVASLNEGASIAGVSSFGSSFAAEKALDDDYDSRWVSATGRATNQFIIVDLAGSDAHLIDRVRIVNASGSEGVRNFRIDVSNTTADASAFTTVGSGTLSDSELVQELVFAPVQARYVRLFVLDGRSSSTVSVRSFEIITPKLSGVPSYLAPPIVGRFYEGATVSGSGAVHHSVDGDVSTTWSVGKSQAPVGEYVFPQTYRIDRLRLINSGDTTGRSVKNFRVEVSVGSTVPTVFTTVLEATAADNAAPQEFVFPGGAVDARVVRVALLSNYGNAYVTDVRELEFVTAPGPRSAVSSYQARYRPEMLLDGAANTAWMTAYTRVAGEFVTLYLGDSEPQLIDGVALTSSTPSGVADFEVLVSDTTDAPDAFRQAVSGRLANDSKLHEFPFAGGVMRARYVMLVVKSNYGGPYASLGTFLPRTVDSAGNLISAPVPPPPTRHLSPAHIANGATVTASSGTPSLMLDYVNSSTWSTANKTAQWAKIDLAGDQPHLISGVIVGPRLGSASMPADAPKAFEIWVSSTTLDDAAFTKIYSGTVTVNGLNRFEFPATAAKFIKYVPLTSQGTSTSIGTGYFDVMSNAGGVIAWSSSRDINVGPLAFDGSRSTYWLTSGTSNEWLTVALPGTATQQVYGVYIDPYGGEGPKEFEIRISNTTAEPSAFTTAYTGTVTDASQRNYYFGRTFDAKYVQFYWKSTSGSWTIGVFDLGVLTVTNSGAAVIGLSGTASHTTPIESMIDANPRDHIWMLPPNRTTNEFLTVALPGDAFYLVDHVALQGPTSCCGDRLPREFEIQVSTDDASDETFRTVFRGTMRSHPSLMQHFFFPPTPARHVRLMVRNNWGSSTMWLQSFMVFSPQVGSMTARFLDASSEPESIVSWEWDFGDGGRSTERDPVHQYAAPGLYQVRLTVRDKDAHSSTYTLSYRAEGPPVADFTFSPNPSNEGANVTFVDASISNLGAVTNHRWSWGDNTDDTIDGASAAHAFDDNGTYAVTHTVSNARGITASVKKEATVRNVAPLANAGKDVVGTWGDDWGASPSSFDASAADRASLLCRWNFGNGQQVDLPNCYSKPTRYAYQAPGTYTATLTVIDKDGASHSDTLIATMGPRKSALRFTRGGEVVPDQPIAIEAILRDLGTGVPIANREVVFTMEGQSATAITDAAGYARTTLPYLGLEENPTVTASFAGDSWYQKSTVAAAANCAINPDVLDIVLLFDVSGSMGAPLAEAKTAARDFLTHIKPKDAVSIISFADDARIDSELGLDRTLTNKALDQLSIRGGTLIHVGLDASRLELLGPRRRTGTRPILILLSDGEAAESPAIAAADQAKAAGIRIISIAVNNSTPGMELMKKLASPGDYYVSTKTEELNSIYASIVGTFCTPTNKPPVVIAPFDQTLIVPQYSVALDATVRDDGLPAYSTLAVSWSTVSGPGNVTFANASAPDTTATFDTIGTYVLRLSATDTQYTRTDDVTITIKQNTAPVVNAGADRMVGLPPGTVSLSGTASDETVPAGATLKTTWSVTSGAGTVTFGDANALATTATFSAVGTYTLKLTATDTLVTSSDEVVLTVVANDLPVVTAGADQRIALGANLLINGGNDEPLVAGAIRGWTPVSGTWSHPAAGTNGLPSALRGDSYFHAATSATAELRQDVDVSALASRIDAGQQQFAWSAFARNAAEPVADTANVIIEYRNADNTAVLARHGVEITAAQWTEGEGTNTAPAGTRWIRVRLAATRRSGATTDVYIDAVTLRAVAAAQTTLAGSATDDGVPQPLQAAWSVVSGPGAVTFGNSTSATSTAVASTAGDYTLRLTANDGSSAVTDDMLLTVAAANGAPSVNAGSDAEVRLPSSATLTAIVTDDSGPAPIALRWELVSGPEAVTFSEPTAASTVVTFTKGGQYRFRVTVDDSDEIAFDEITINVLSTSGNAAPNVDAGADVVIAPPNTSATLNGSVSDDGLPAGSTLATSWSQLSGTGTTTFSDATSRTPTVTFTRHGIYTLRLTASDGELTTTDDVTVRYDGTNQAPTVDAGADQTAKLSAAANLAATVTDDNLPLGASLSLTWTKVSGPGLVTFSANTSATTTATFSETGTYVLRLTANDSALTASDEVTIAVEAALPAPTVEITSPESGAAITNRVVVTGVVSDAETWKLEYRSNGNDAAAGMNPWTVIGSGSGAVNGPVGTFDPTVLLNGTYKIRLVATASDGQTDAASISVVVEGGLKVGLFTIAFTDLDVPAPGLSLQITRTYDSRDKRSRDFGVGWSLGFRSTRVEKTGVLGTAWEVTRSSGPFPNYCLQTVAARLVTVALGNGRVLRFKTVVSPSCQALAPIEGATVAFEALPGTDAKLEALDDNDVLVVGSKPGPVQLWTADATPYNPTRFRLTLGDGTRVVLDEIGGIETVTDLNGNKLTVTRDGILHSSGRSVTFARDAAGRITRITDPAGGTLTYTYDGRGDLVATTDQVSATTRYVYNAAHGLVEYFDSSGRRGVKTEYDDAGRMIAMTDADGKTTSFDYDPALRREAVTDRKGRVRVYEYDVRGNALSVKDSDGKGSTATYDALGNLLTHVDKLGHKTAFTYDARGNVLTVTDNDGRVQTRTYNERNQVTSITDANGHATRYEYDEVGSRVAEIDAAGHRTTHMYDDKGNVKRTTDPDGNAVTFDYDARGQLLTSTNTLGKATRFTYNDLGRVTSTTSAKGYMTQFAYDAAGRELAITDAKGNVTRTEFNAAGDPVARVDSYGNRIETVFDGERMPLTTTLPNGVVVTQTYDAENNIVGTATSAGLSTSEERDARDLVTKVTLAPGITIGYDLDDKGRVLAETDARGATVRYAYDSRGLKTSETDAAARQIEYAYDPAGNLSSVVDANDHATTYEYDAMKRLTRAAAGDASLTTEYNWRGDVVSRRDPEGNTVRYGYDSEGNLTSITEPNGAITKLEYDDNGNRTSIIDAEARVTRFEYDELDRPVRRSYPDGTNEVITYDGAVRMVSRTDRAGRKVMFGYDEMNRITTTTYADGSTVSVTYTALNKRDLVTDARGVTDYDYDALGNLTSVKHPDGTTVAYTYDAAGNRTSMTTPHGQTTYHYDATGRFTRVVDPHGHETSYGYDPAGNLVRTTYPNGMVTSLEYDAHDLVNAVKTTGVDGTILFHETYVRDRNGQLTKVGKTDGSSETYEYDAVLRLVNEVHRAADGTVLRSLAYTYDALGNRQTLSNAATGATTTYVYDEHDRLTGTGSTTYTYNDLGHTETSTTAAGPSTYAYDIRERLTSVARGAGTSTYVYDADGNRVRATTADGATTEYVLDSEAPNAVVIAERDASRQVIAAYTYGLGLVSMERGGEEYYYVYDARGSVRALVSSAGVVTDRYAYSAFGELSGVTGTTTNPFRFGGEQQDPETGLYYLRSRYYDPATGRFLQRDTFPGRESDPRSLNRYVYALNNPVNLSDPSGRDPLDGGAGDSIGKYYIGRHGDYFVTGTLPPGHKRRPANRGFEAIAKLVKPGWGAYDRNIRNAPRTNKERGGVGVRVDLRHYATGDVYEVKPMHLWPAAVFQSIAYAALLNAYEDEVPTTGFWDPGKTTFPAMIQLGQLEVRSCPIFPPGVVVYSAPDQLLDDLLAASLLTVASSALIPAAGNLRAGMRAERLLRLAPKIALQARVTQSHNVVSEFAANAPRWTVTKGW